jgi:hypothetical protein
MVANYPYRIGPNYECPGNKRLAVYVGLANFAALLLPRVQPCAIARRNFLGIHLIA